MDDPVVPEIAGEYPVLRVRGQKIKFVRKVFSLAELVKQCSVRAETLEQIFGTISDKIFAVLKTEDAEGFKNIFGFVSRVDEGPVQRSITIINLDTVVFRIGHPDFTVFVRGDGKDISQFIFWPLTQR